ncbi:chloride channel CLIC-like protein 1 [Anabas testudineus]|uniref:Chloride channel CLIC-like protein 1 n=1 Tax=Anabas testudineus TaxID=64144 RepID=A0A3Q1I305_ANATE|nr:chloride channel CLIC-like protein 1 [Anabas testudineus]
MILIVLVCTLSLSVMGQQAEDDWVDPYDMLNYDAGTKTMRKPAEPVNYNNVATKRREYTQDSTQAELESCSRQMVDLKKQIEEQKKKIQHMSQQPSCSPVFKRFLSRLLNEIRRVGLPTDSSDIFFDAKVRLSKQSMTEIQKLVEGEDSWSAGALDNAISQILVDLRPHDYEAWKWRFEDTFGVELDTLLKIGLFILICVVIICTELWTAASWFVQFRRLFAVCFFVSIIWNWFYLYKIAFAEHQNNIVKMDSVNEKCTGVKKIEWSDSLREWFRMTWTLQDDPCKKYYEVLMVNPILLVPPTKAISVTITTFITEPLKHFGQGISEFLRALLKDLPVTLQIPVLLTIVLSIVVCMYGSVQAAFRHGITAPLRRHRRDPPPPELEQQQPRLQRIEGHDPLAGGDAPYHAPAHYAPAPHAPAHQAPPYQVPPPQSHDFRLDRNQVHQRRPNRTLNVENIGNAYREDVTDAARQKVEQTASAMLDSENQQETEEEPAAASGSSVAAQAKTKPTESKPAESKAKVNKNCAHNEPTRDNSAPPSPPAGRQPSQADVEDVGTSAEGDTCTGVPVQETGRMNPALLQDQ